jgi:hypothetical protein
VIWKGREVSSPGDYVTVLARIETTEEANDFRAVMMESGAIDRKIADRNLGYLTGYMPHDVGARVRRLFDVQHPIMGELVDDPELCQEEILLLGMEFHKYYGEQHRDFDEAAMLARQAVLMLRDVRMATTTNGEPDGHGQGG